MHVKIYEILERADIESVSRPVLRPDTIAINTLLHQTLNSDEYREMEKDKKLEHLQRILPLCGPTLAWIRSIQEGFHNNMFAWEEIEDQIKEIWQGQQAASC